MILQITKVANILCDKVSMKVNGNRIFYFILFCHQGKIIEIANGEYRDKMRNE